MLILLFYFELIIFELPAKLGKMHAQSALPMVVIWLVSLRLTKTRRSLRICNNFQITKIVLDRIPGLAGTTALRVDALGWTEVIGAM